MKKALFLCMLVLVASSLCFAGVNKGAISKFPAPSKLIPASNPTPLGGPCLYYDDGVIGNGWAWYEAGSYWGVWMTAPSYPYAIDDVEYMNYVGWPDSNNYPVTVSIWDCATGAKLIEEADMPYGQGIWNVHILATPVTVTGDFIVAIGQTTPYPTCNGMGVDDLGGGWAMRDQTYYYAAPPWSPGCYTGAGYGNFMIRTNCSPCCISCKLEPYQTKVPRGGTYDICKSWTNFDDVPHVITGKLYFYHEPDHTLLRSVGYPTFTIGAGQTLHKVFALIVPMGIAIGGYSVENIGTYDGDPFRCGPEFLTVIEAADGYVAGDCPSDAPHLSNLSLAVRGRQALNEIARIGVHRGVRPSELSSRVASNVLESGGGNNPERGTGTR